MDPEYAILDCVGLFQNHTQEPAFKMVISDYTALDRVLLKK